MVNFRAITVVNGNISTPFDIKRGCRQGDPILGYLFILVLEILGLMLAKEMIKLYRKANRINHLLDMYTDNLTIYMEYNKRRSWCNEDNVKRILDISNPIYACSGLKINLGKTYLTIF